VLITYELQKIDDKEQAQSLFLFSLYDKIDI